MNRRLTAAFAALTALLLAFSCGQRKTETAAPQVRQFPMPSVPGVMSDPSERAEYIAAHFWDAFADTATAWKNDSLHIAGVRTEEMEQQLANFLFTLDNVPVKTAREDVEKFYAQILSFAPKDTSVFGRVVRLAQRYFYDPNSPLRNEDYYGALAAKLASCPLYGPEKQGVFAYEARMCSLNMTGTPAADFSWSDRNGRMHRLYDIKAEYTLLFFSNPGCEACKDIIEALSSNSNVASLIITGRLAVVNVYIDEDVAAWYAYMSFYPTSWYNGYDPNLVIREDVLYNIRAIPSLYLLDSQKRVILKDVPEERLLIYLDNIL